MRGTLVNGTKDKTCGPLVVYFDPYPYLRIFLIRQTPQGSPQLAEPHAGRPTCSLKTTTGSWLAWPKPRCRLHGFGGPRNWGGVRTNQPLLGGFTSLQRSKSHELPLGNTPLSINQVVHPEFLSLPPNSTKKSSNSNPRVLALRRRVSCHVTSRTRFTTEKKRGGTCVRPLMLKNAVSESISPPHAQLYGVRRWGSGPVLEGVWGEFGLC